VVMPPPEPPTVAAPQGPQLPSGARRWRCSDIDKVSERIYESASGPIFVFEVSFHNEGPLLVSNQLPPDVRTKGLKDLEAVRKAVVGCKGQDKDFYTTRTNGHFYWDTRDGPNFVPGQRVDWDELVWEAPKPAGPAADASDSAAGDRVWKCGDITRVTDVLEVTEPPSFVVGVTFKSRTTLLISRETAFESRVNDLTDLIALRDVVASCKGGSKVLVANNTKPHGLLRAKGGHFFNQGEPLVDWKDLSVKKKTR
jgi:hypothetical protein